MKTLSLTDDEMLVLSEIVRSRLASLETEILHTDHSEYRTWLKQRRTILARIGEKLPAPAESGDSGR